MTLIIRLAMVMVVLFAIGLMVGCQSCKPEVARPTWKRFFPSENILLGDKLLGVQVQQENDVVGDFSHKGKHPAMVIYYLGQEYGDLEVCQVGFSPEGDVEEVFWWKDRVKRSEIGELEPPPK